LAEDTRRAYANGIFGVPTFVCNDELFFGNDRLDMLAWRLGSGGVSAAQPTGFFAVMVGYGFA
jgi:hypothetical protein